MKFIFQRLARFFDPDSAVSRPAETAVFQHPLPRGMVGASLTCILSLLCTVWVGRPLVERLALGGFDWLLYALVPLASTFAILHRSNWHPEMARTQRICYLFLLSCAILTVLLLAVGISVLLVGFCSGSLPKSGGR